MTQQEKIQILLSAIEASMHLEPGQKELIHKALIEGQLKIVQLESDFRKATESFHYFPVEIVKEGFVFWNHGGFTRERKMGRAIVAAAHDLSELKVLRTMKEKNGRHTQCIVYQGCFLCEYENYDNDREIYRIYQIVSLIGRSNGCEAKCQRLITSADKFYDSCLSAKESSKFSRLIEAAYAMATRVDNVSTEYRVS